MYFCEKLVLWLLNHTLVRINYSCHDMHINVWHVCTGYADEWILHLYECSSHSPFLEKFDHAFAV